MAGFCIIGGQFVLNNFTVASYETEMRATAVGMELAVGRLGAILGPFIGGTLQQVFGGHEIMLVAIALAATGTAVCVLFARRTTSGQSGVYAGRTDDPTTVATGVTPGG